MISDGTEKKKKRKKNRRTSLLGGKKGSQPVAGYRGDWLSEDLQASMLIFLSLNRIFIFVFAFVNLVYLLCIVNIKYTLKCV